jgi:hypothetical protein
MDSNGRKHITNEPLLHQPAPVEPDWKAEYLKSVESGCITLDELREANAELAATNRQVEILSDALAESRREVASLKANAALDKKAENARELGLDYEPVEYWNAVEGWVKIDEVREHFDSVGCGTIYKTAGDGRVPLTAAQRQWQGLTDEDFENAFQETYIMGDSDLKDFARAIGAKLKEKNT